MIDLLEEARAVELDERLATGVRGIHDAASLLRMATADGHASLGWPDAGRIAPGAPGRPDDDRPRLGAHGGHARRARPRDRRVRGDGRPTSTTSSSAAASSSATAGTSTIDVAAELRAVLAW